MADETLNIDINVNGTEEIDRAKASALALQNVAKSGVKIKVDVDQSGIRQGTSALGTLSSKAKSVGSVLQGVSNSLNVVSATLQNIGNNMQMVGRFGLIGSALLGGAGISGLAKLTKLGVSGAMEIENATQQIRAQGVSAEKTSEIMQYVRTYANQSAFSTQNLASSLSDVNSYLGDIDRSKRVVEVFGTSLMATGRSASELARVGVNLGQLGSGQFNKTDFKELVRGVPAISQALRDMNISGWEQFNEALGDNPNTKEIERTGDALELVTNALDAYNVKTNAFEESQKSLSARWENTTGVIQDSLAQAVQNSGLYEKLGTMLDNVAEGFEKNIPAITKFYDWLGKAGVKASEFIRDFDFQKFGKGFTSAISGIKDTISGFIDDNKAGFDKLKNYFTEGKTGAEGMGQALGNIFGASTKLYFGGTAVKALSSVISLLSTGTGLAANFAKGLGGVFGYLDKKNTGKSNPLDNIQPGTRMERIYGGTFSKIGKRLGVDGSKQMSRGITDGVRSLQMEDAITKGIVGIDSKTGRTTSRLRSAFTNLFPQAAQIGTWMAVSDSRLAKGLNTGTKTLTTTLSTGANKIQQIGTSAATSFKSAGRAIGSGVKRGISFVGQNLLGIGTDVLLITQAVKQFDELPDAGTVAKGFAKVGAVMTGMSLLNTLTGSVAKKANVNQAMGSFVNLLNAGTIVAMSKAINQLDDLPSAGEIATGFTKLSAVSIGMSALNGVIGGVGLAFGGIPSLAIGLGALTNILNAGSMASLAKGIKQLDGLPSQGVIDRGMEKLTKVTAAMTSLNLGSTIGSGFGITSLVGRFNSWNQSKIVSHVVKAGQDLERLAEVKIPNSVLKDGGTVSKIVEAMGNVAQEFSGMDAFENVFKKSSAKSLSKIVSSVANAGKSLETLNDVNIPSVSSVGKTAGEISDVLTTISDQFSGDFFTAKFKDWETGSLAKMVESITNSLSGLESLGKFTVPKGIKKKSESIATAMKDVSDNFGMFFEYWQRNDQNTTVEKLEDTIDSMVNSTKGLEKINDAKIPKNIDGKVTRIADAMKSLSDGVGDIKIDDNTQTTMESFSKIADSVSSVSEDLGKLTNIELPSLDKIKEIGTTIGLVNSSIEDAVTDNGKVDINKKLTSKYSNLSKITESIGTMTTEFSGIANSLTGLQDVALDTQKVSDNVGDVLSSTGTLYNSFKNWFAGSTWGKDFTVENQFGNTGGGIIKTGKKELTNLTEMVTQIGEIATTLGGMKDSLAKFNDDGFDSGKIQEGLTKMGEAIHHVNGFFNDDALSNIKKTLNKGVDGESGIGKGEKGNQFKKVIDRVTTLVTDISELQTAFTNLPEVDVGAIQGRLEQVMQVVDSLQNLLNNEVFGKIQTALGQDLGQGDDAGDADLSQFDTIFTKIQSIVTKMSELQGILPQIESAVVNVQAVQDRMGELTGALQALQGFLSSDVLSGLGSTLQGGSAGSVYGSFGANLESGTSGEGGAIDSIIEQVKQVATKVNELQGVLVQIQEAQLVADQVQQAMQQMMTSLQNIITTFTSDAMGDVQGAIDGGGITAMIDQIKTFVTQVKTALDELNNLTEGMTTTGQNIGQAFVTGFQSVDFSSMTTKITETLTQIATLGTTYGAQLASNFNGSTAGMGDTAVSEAERVSSAINAIPKSVSITITADASSALAAIAQVKDAAAGLSGGGSLGQIGAGGSLYSSLPGFSDGGLIKSMAKKVQYFSQGGQVNSSPFASTERGTDKIPAWLSVGEFVQQRRAVSYWGTPLMNALNDRNPFRVAQLLQHRMGATGVTKTITNNQVTNSPTVINNFGNTDGSAQYLELTRLMGRI